MPDTTKETVYIDVDDEITTVIEKVLASDHRIVALVLPKRAATLQSIVNMKLLKRAAEDARKKVVLITSEVTLLPLAGIAGLHVAKTLQTKPFIPPVPEADGEPDIVEETDAGEADDSADAADGQTTLESGKNAKLASAAALGAAAGAGAAATSREPETIDVDAEPAGDAGDAAAKKGKRARIKIPNFEKFRLKLVLGVLLIALLIGGYVLGFMVLPSARVVVRTDQKSVSSTLNFTANTAAKEVDKEKSIVPAESKETKKTDSQKITATGQKNVGEKASGTVQLQNCTSEDGPVTLPAGTIATMAGLSFSMVSDVVLPASVFSGSKKCLTATVSANIVAQGAGEQYNLTGRGCAISGYSLVNGSCSDMSGGTTQNVTVVSQQDLDNAKTQLADKSKDVAKTELVKALQDAGLKPLDATLFAGDAAVLSSTPKLGDEATEVTVTVERTYSMLGVKEDVLKTLVEEEAKTQLDLTKQPLVDYGLTNNTYQLVSKRSATDQSVSTAVTAVAGAKLDAEAIKTDILGKKRGEVVKIIETQPGVKEVDVQFSPAWVSKIPTKPAKVTIVFEQVTTAATDGN